MKKILLIFSFSTLILAGCTSTPSNPRDTLEPLNRRIYSFNDKADRWVIKPVAQTYHDYTPQFLRAGVTNFFNNITDGASAVNYALQGKPQPSLYNLSRFLLNSTVGILGILDVASADERMYPQSGFGDTFAVWGWKNSNYFVMPLIGPSTLRDGSGSLSGIFFQNNLLYNDIENEILTGSTILSGVNTRERLLGVEDIITDAALDPYVYTRDAWLQMRAKQTGDDLPHNNEEDINIDDLMN